MLPIGSIQTSLTPQIKSGFAVFSIPEFGRGDREIGRCVESLVSSHVSKETLYVV